MPCLARTLVGGVQFQCQQKTNPANHSHPLRRTTLQNPSQNTRPPSFVAKWLTANGTTIFPESTAPIRYLSDNSQLFIGDPSHPVAVKVNQTSNSVLVAGNTAVQGKTTGPLVQSVGWVTTRWSVDNEKLSLGWTVAGMGNMSFVYSNSNVWAVFGDVGADNVSEMRYHANLVPSFS
jgi:hypothetical protein